MNTKRHVGGRGLSAVVVAMLRAALVTAGATVVVDVGRPETTSVA